MKHVIDAGKIATEFEYTLASHAGPEEYKALTTLVNTRTHAIRYRVIKYGQDTAQFHYLSDAIEAYNND